MLDDVDRCIEKAFLTTDSGPCIWYLVFNTSKYAYRDPFGQDTVPASIVHFDFSIGWLSYSYLETKAMRKCGTTAAMIYVHVSIYIYIYIYTYHLWCWDNYTGGLGSEQKHDF